MGGPPHILLRMVRVTAVRGTKGGFRRETCRRRDGWFWGRPLCSRGCPVEYQRSRRLWVAWYALYLYCPYNFHAQKICPKKMPIVLYSLRSAGAGNGVMLLVLLRATGRNCS